MCRQKVKPGGLFVEVVKIRAPPKMTPAGEEGGMSVIKQDLGYPV